MKENRLYRIVNGKVIGGVAGGLAEYFGIDPTIIRIIFILLTVMGGGGLLVYVILWIVVPEKYDLYPPFNAYASGTSTTTPGNPSASSATGVGETYEGYAQGKTPSQPAYPANELNKSKVDGSLIAGLVLILIGGFFLFERFVPDLDFGDFWPLLLVLVGALMIMKGVPALRKKEEPADQINDNDNNTTNNDINL